VSYFTYSSSLAGKILTIVLSQSQESLTSQAGQKIRAQVWKDIVELLDKEYLEVVRIVVYEHRGKVGRKNWCLCWTLCNIRAYYKVRRPYLVVYVEYRG
jgi:hypothetical protein